MNWLFAAFCFVAGAAYAADTDIAANATNQLGIDLYRQLSVDDQNLCLSPYSIQSALAMTFVGSDGDTKVQMAHTLRYSVEDDATHVSFAALRRDFDAMIEKAAKISEHSKKFGGPTDPITFAIANRLFAQTGYDFRGSFRDAVTKFYGAAFEVLDFRKNPQAAREQINKWVLSQTHDRIRDLIPAKGLSEKTRLVLTNAIYLKAPWANEFPEAFTKPKPFHIGGGQAVDVPMMENKTNFGYGKRDGFTAVGVPYSGGDLQLLILLPDDVAGLTGLKPKLTAETLANSAKLETREVDLELPKFMFASPTMMLADKLKLLGMKSAFDDPPGSADFDKIAPRKPNNYLAISQVFHKTFIAVDEKGTEAAAATAVAMLAMAARIPKPEPVIVKVDRPFIYAIQHVPSGTCLFLGQVIDPR